MQAVPAATSGGIVEGNLKIVVSQEPVESRPCVLAPAALAGCAIGLQTCGDGCTGFHRLLVEARLLRVLRIKTLRSDGYEMAFQLAALNRHQPIQRFESHGNHLIVCSAHSRSDKRLRQSGVGIREYAFKPFPALRVIGPVEVQESV